MKIIKAEFITSADCLKSCPTFNLPEIALIGRSNVGKSSFINAICNRKNMARTSNTPGKTRLINFYNINDIVMMVDLPGYGYAKISKQEQEKWKKNLEEYLLKRIELKSVIQFIDARHDVQNNDFLMREWLKYNNIPIITIATKIDTLTRNHAQKSVTNITSKLGCEIIPFSAKSGTGKDNFLNLLQNLKN